MKWSTIRPYEPLIRTFGNFGTVFFSSMLTFVTVYSIPTIDSITGALMTATFTTGVAISYEARKFSIGKKKRKKRK